MFFGELDFGVAVFFGGFVGAIGGVLDEERFGAADEVTIR